MTNPTGTAQFTANVDNHGDGRIHLAAFYGTQARGYMTGNFLDGTDFGTIGITVTDGTNEATVKITDETPARALHSALGTAINVADSRDICNDQRNQE